MVLHLLNTRAIAFLRGRFPRFPLYTYGQGEKLGGQVKQGGTERRLRMGVETRGKAGQA